MNLKPLLSLCIPTNGIIEWVFPVLDSIYVQGMDASEFEVIVTDNGNNKMFKQKIQEYEKKYKNFIYVETDASSFLNEIESYKRAKGELIKFVNHRTKLLDGTLDRLIQFIHQNIKNKPIVYFSNGVLKKEKKQYVYDSFDQFVLNLSYWSSWSTGMAIWKEDFAKLPKDITYFNELFPHTNVLFFERNKKRYIIDNTIIFKEIPQEKKPKGNYDLFFAFGIEYPWIICNLLRDKSITAVTYRKVMRDNLYFIAVLYLNYVVLKKYCSYDLNGLDDMYDVFYTHNQIRKALVISILGQIKSTLIRIIRMRHRTI